MYILGTTNNDWVNLKLLLDTNDNGIQLMLETKHQYEVDYQRKYPSHSNRNPEDDVGSTVMEHTPIDTLLIQL